MKMGKLDWQILAELDNDARQSSSKIAKKLRVNKNVVNYRIKNLECKGIIRGYYTVIDSYRLGYSSYRIYLKLQNASPEKEKEIMDYLVALPDTWWIGTIKGKYNIGALVWVKTQEQFVKVWLKLNEKFRPYIEEYVVVTYHRLEHYRLPFTKKYLKEKAKIEIIGGAEIVRTDDTDKAILRLISANARISLLELSKKLKLTPAAIQYRVKQLVKKKVILGYRAIIDQNKLGYTLYKMNFNLNNMQAYGKMGKFAQQHEDIFYLDKSVGYADIEIEIYTKSSQRFYEIMDEIRTKFADAIKDYDFFIFSEITKLAYMPNM